MNASATPLVSRGTRFDAFETNATQRGPWFCSPSMSGRYDGPFAGPPFGAREISSVLPFCHGGPDSEILPVRWTRKTSVVPFVSPDTMFDASESKAASVASWRAVRPLAPLGARELVLLVLGHPAEQLRDLVAVLGHEVHGKRARPLRHAVGVVTDRDAGEEARRIDARLACEADEAAGTFAAV